MRTVIIKTLLWLPDTLSTYLKCVCNYYYYYIWSKNKSRHLPPKLFNPIHFWVTQATELRTRTKTNQVVGVLTESWSLTFETILLLYTSVTTVRDVFLFPFCVCTRENVKLLSPPGPGLMRKTLATEENGPWHQSISTFTIYDFKHAPHCLWAGVI